MARNLSHAQPGSLGSVRSFSRSDVSVRPVVEAEREAALKALEPIHRKRVAEAKRLHAAQVRRQKKLLRELGVPDLSPEEITEKARRPSAERP